ncbi:Beige/BEACH domain protein [Ancylostoma caninum]|uniref:Beige/BEACH domain protein n=1 Tax=Ancylostoma caninum TaxID=29170 RepID=A0A368FW71_ANCCA|nr:Beige/BEACH domain protein [Ancylostoma caninum]
MAMFTPTELKAEFKEILNFTTFLCSVLVREVRQRAASHGTVEAATSIADYLQPSSAQKGWLLLNSIYFLISTEDEAIINAVCKVSLPSTLVKTIYLFFDLPDNEELVEARQKLNELLTCLLDRLCSYRNVSEELAKKDDLLLLFVGSSSSLSEQNAQWRKTTARVLEALSAKSLTPVVIKYIHTKECIKTFISNIRSPKLQPQETAEMIICLLCVLKDSARQTNQLVEDFSQSNGYLAIKDFILKNEDQDEIVRNILLMLISVITNGPQEIKPQSQNPTICATAIDIVHSVYTCDPANYFILDKEYPLALFIEQLDRKDEVVRAKILELVEHCVFHLNYIPCKELIGICVQMKTELASGQQDICVAAVQAAFRLLTVDSVIKDAFREVGLLDTLCYIINNLFAQYKRSFLASSDELDVLGDQLLDYPFAERNLTENEKKLTLLATDLLTVIIKGNLENARMFSDCFGARNLLSVLTVVTGEWRSSSLQLLKQLLLLASTDQYIAGVIQVISQVAPQQQLEFNVDLLKTVLGVLRESHKVRVQFRKTGGYLGLITMLLGLEGAFSRIDGTGGTVPTEAVELLDFIHLIFKVLTISMRFEPSNAKYFSVEVSWDSITTVLRLTGAFDDNTVIDVVQPEWKLQCWFAVHRVTSNECSLSQGSDLKDKLAACHSVFKMDEDIQSGSIPSGMPPSIFFASYIIRLLFNMALDNYEKMSSDVTWTSSDGSLEECIVSWTSSVLVHPGAVQSILSLLPSIHSENVKWLVSAQYYCGLLLKALLKPERNQQLMCQVDMPKHLLSIASKLFLCENHILLHPFYYVLERLSYQSMQPSQLRHFLRLDLPLCCRNLDETENEEPIRPNEGGPVPLQRVKALVSMMTPRDQRLSHAPSFVETDLAMEGFGCLFIPSLAPLFSSIRSERVFPPLNGISLSTWLYIDAFSDKKLDAHPLRLLTITRTVTWQDERRKQGPCHLACLTVQISPIDRSLLISTDEHENPGGDLEKEAKIPSEKAIRIAMADIVRPMEWTHFCVVLSRSVLKPSQASVYINGRLVSTQKLQYIVQTAGGAATQLAQTHVVNAMIGTLPAMRRPSRLRFRLASTFLIEEPLSAETVRSIYDLQPHYVGSLQAIGAERTSLVQEEKIVFALNGMATSEMTLAKIRTVHNKLDAEILAPHVLRGFYVFFLACGIRNQVLYTIQNACFSHCNVHRLKGSMPGPSSYLGMRTFIPRPVPRLLDSMGGFACLYGLVAMATDSEGLYASLKAVVSAVRSNSNLQTTLHANRAYQTLAVLLEDKANLLNSHIMHMVFSMAGTLDTAREVATIPNAQAFEDLLCDLDVWASAPDEQHRMLYEHFYELITDHQRENLAVVRRSPLLSRVLFALFDRPQLLWATNEIVFNLLSAIVQPQCDNRSMLKLGQAIAATLPTTADDLAVESQLPFHISELHNQLIVNQKPDEGKPSVLYNVYVRNRLLNMIANFLSHSSPQLNQHMADQIVRVLGFDWIYCLLSPGVHSGTVFLALRILLALLAHPQLLAKFREGTANGGWLADADSVVRNRAAVVLGFSVSAHGGAVGSKIDINPELQNCAGFAALEHLMAAHADKPHAYLAMLAVLVGQPVKDLRFCESFNVDQIWTHVFGLSLNSSVYEAIRSAEFCYDALIPLLAMLRACIYSGNEVSSLTLVRFLLDFVRKMVLSPFRNSSLNKIRVNELQALQGWHVDYPSAVIQMITFLYQNSPNFFAIAHSEEFVLAMFSSLIQDTNAMGMRSEAADRSTVGTPEFEKVQGVLALPSVKAVLDFMKKLFCDDFQVAAGGRADSLVDVITESVVENGSTRKSQIHTFTALVHGVFDHLISTDLLVSSSLPPNAPPQSLSQVGVNISYMALRAVDCLWNGILVGEPLNLLQLLYSIYSIASRKENKEINLDSLTSSIMRCVLYILSRPIENVQVQMSVLDTLSSVVTKRYIFLSSNESWFFTSLTHLIFMLSVTPDIMQQDGAPLEKASAQVAVCASRVWTDVISSKKALLEEAFKKPTVCELNAARALLANVAGQHWHQFVDSQLSGQYQNHTISKDIQTQISSKITRVASGLHKLASRRTLSSHGSISAVLPWKNVSVDKEVIHMWLRVHVSLVKELVVAQATRYHEWHAHAKKWSLHEWHQLEAELTRERGIWGPEKASVLDKYKLDTTEGPSRTRRKMIPNRFFYHTFPYRPHLDEPGAKSMRAKVAISRDSELYFNACRRRRGRIMDTRIIDYSVAISTPSEEKPAFTFCDLAQINTSLIRRLSTRPALEALPSTSENDDNGKENENGEENGAKEPSVELEEDQQDESSASDKPMSESREEAKEEEKKDNENKKKRGPDNQTLLRLLEQGEQLHSMFRCARIQGLETSEGLLLFGREHYYVVDGFTLLKTREIRDLDFLSQELHDPIVPYTATGATHPPRSSRLCSKFSYEDIREVHKRRYLLQPIALEVFSADGRNYLLAFPKKMRDRVYEKLLSMAKGLTSGGTDSVGGQKANMAIEQSGRASLINSIIGQQSVTQRWLNGQITNFQYLIHLNTLAGRSYNDLSQYPILPWVLADYTSTTLDFTNPKTFRDLSKPMGAQHPQRLEQFLKRYREWDDPTGETPPYMYGTHYSSAMIVVSYLVRLEPFTQQFLSLQGGHFDLADRMFHSIGDAWTSASRNNMADVKELIPEFFVLPELLLNKNRFDFGVKQNGIALDDVVLPPWAHGDAREFIRLHRQALECDYVSSHLHEWIDLVFGYKQNGEEAVKANNLFHHLFYEGSVDFESIIDPLTRNATIGFVNNFGQIPTQLFKKPHPQKKVSPVDGFSNTPGVTTQRLFYHSLHSLKPPQSPIKELRSAVGSIYQNDRAGLIVLEQNKVLIGTNKYIAWGYPDRSIRMGQIDSDKSSCIHEMCDADELTCVASGDDRTLFCGSSTGCVSVWTLCRKPVSLKRRKLLDGHSDAVTCLVVCSAHAFVVSASRDCSVILWHQSELYLIRQLPVHPSPVSAVAVNDTTGDIATSCSTLLHLWSINGDLLAVVNTCDSNLIMDPSQMILSLTFSTMNEWDSDNVVVCGTSDGVVKIYSCVMVENDGSVEEPHMEPQV